MQKIMVEVSPAISNLEAASKADSKLKGNYK